MTTGADAYPMLSEIEKPQVWRKTRQAHALQEKRVAATDVYLFLEVEEELALFGRIRIFSLQGGDPRDATPFP